MTWYVASVIMSVKKKHENQKNIPVYENFILIEADNQNIARDKATSIAKNEADINCDLWLNERPAKMVFEGIRKLITISNPVDVVLNSSPPITGTELTYSEYLIKTKGQLKNLIKGKAVNIKYIE
jgi:Ni2+-binding GTPase involved in maturation of urease and hydrogenase